MTTCSQILRPQLYCSEGGPDITVPSMTRGTEKEKDQYQFVDQNQNITSYDNKELKDTFHFIGPQLPPGLRSVSEYNALTLKVYQHPTPANEGIMTENKDKHPGDSNSKSEEGNACSSLPVTTVEKDKDVHIDSEATQPLVLSDSSDDHQVPPQCSTNTEVCTPTGTPTYQSSSNVSVRGRTPVKFTIRRKSSENLQNLSERVDQEAHVVNLADAVNVVSQSECSSVCDDDGQSSTPPYTDDSSPFQSPNRMMSVKTAAVKSRDSNRFQGMTGRMRGPRGGGLVGRCKDPAQIIEAATVFKKPKPKLNHDWFDGFPTTVDSDEEKHKISVDKPSMKINTPPICYKPYNNAASFFTPPCETYAPKAHSAPTNSFRTSRWSQLDSPDISALLSTSIDSGSSISQKLDCVRWCTWRDKFRQRFASCTELYIDTHCHIDFLFDRCSFSGSFKQYIQENADTFPKNYAGCVAVFCNPRKFTPEGKLLDYVGCYCSYYDHLLPINQII